MIYNIFYGQEICKEEHAMYITERVPWKDHMGGVPLHLEYPQGSMFDAVREVAAKYPDYIAFDFMGRSTTYKKLVEQVEACAKSLKTLGVRAGDRITIAMPNCPQAIFMFYAVNLVGGISNMIHPLSAEKEIEFYLNESNSYSVITLDQFYNKIEAIRQNTGVVNVIIASVKDELSKPVRAGYMLTEGRKIKKIPADAPVIRWKEFMKLGQACSWNYKVERKGEDPAVILYSGGTTGTTKGIVLTNLNFNALSRQVVAANPMFRHALAARRRLARVLRRYPALVLGDAVELLVGPHLKLPEIQLPQVLDYPVLLLPVDDLQGLLRPQHARRKVLGVLGCRV